MKVRRKRIAVTLLVVLVPIAAGVWLARDLPRRKVQATLAEQLGAEVTVGRLAILGTRHFRLEQVRLRQLQAAPEVARMAIHRIEVHGEPSELIKGRIEHLGIEGVEVTLQPPTSPRKPAAGEGVSIGELTLSKARLVFPGGDHLIAAGRLERIGGDACGTIHIRGDRLTLAAVAAVAALDAREDWPAITLTAPSADATIAGGSLRLSAGAATAEVAYHGRRTKLPDPKLTGTVTGGEEGAYRLDLDAELPWLQGASLDAVTATATTPAQVAVNLRGMRLAEWLEAVAILPAGWTATGDAGVTLHWSPAKGLAYSLHCDSLAVNGPFGPVSGRLAIDGALHQDGENETGPLEIELEVQHLGWAPQRTADLVLPIVGSFAGQHTVKPQEDAGGRLTLRSPEVGHLVTDLNLELGDEPQVDATWRWIGCDLECLLAAAGTLGLELPDHIKVTTSIDARGRVLGEPTAPRINGTLRLTDLRAHSSTDPSWSLSASPTLLLDAEPPYERLALALPKTATSLVVPPLDVLQLNVDARLGVTTNLDSGTVDHLEITSPGLGQALITGAWSPHAPIAAHLLIDLPDIGAVVAAATPLIPEAEPTLDEYRLAGSARFGLDAGPITEGGWTASGSATLADGGFASSDGARVAAGFGGGWRVDLKHDAGGPLHARAQGELTGGQLLWGLVFADFGGRRVDLALDGRQSAPGLELQAACSVPEAVAIQASLGLWEGQPATWSTQVQVMDMATMFETYVRQPLQGSVPAVERLQARGSLAGLLSGTWHDGGFTVGGRLMLSDTDLAGTGGSLRLRGLNLDLPIQMSASRTGDGPLEVRGRPQRGSLSFDELIVRDLSLSTATALVIRGDTVALDRSLRIGLLEGELNLEQLTLTNLLSPSRHLATTIRFHDLSLRQLTQDLDLLPLEGSLDGSFPKVRLTPNRLEVDGTGQLSLFSGTVTVHDISAEDVLSRYPRLLFSADFEGIDLGELTRTFDFGEVTGILAGNINGCEIVRSVPVHFSGQLRTVKSPGVKQTISVRAINNIAIFGTGSGVGLLDRGIHSLLSRYTYDSFGLKMQLEGDHFLLAGLEQRGDRELFLKGRLPFRIDVVNVQPGTTVSFSTLMRRLRNLDFSRVATDSTPP